VEGGTLIVAPDYHDHGTLLISGGTENPTSTDAGSLELSGSGLINGGVVDGEGLIYFKGNPLSGDGHQMVMDQPTGVPEAWMRGGTLELSGGSLLVNSTVAVPDQVVASITTLASSGGFSFPLDGPGVVHTEDLNTGHDLSASALVESSQTIVTGGLAVVADPNADSFTVENTTDRTGGGGIPEAWMRGGALELSGGQLTANNLIVVPDQVGGSITTLASSGGFSLPLDGPRVVHIENLNTGHNLSVPVLVESSQTIVTGGRVVVADPIAGSFTVENGGSLSIGNRVFDDGTYNFNAETAMESQSQAVSAVASTVGAASATVKPEHTAEAHETAPIGFSVAPIVSGSDSPIEAQEGQDLSYGQTKTPLANLHTPTHASVDLPVLINSQEIQHLHAEADHVAGITFVDEDAYEASATPQLDAVPVGVPASTTHDVAAAVGGAFVAGSATQVAPTAKGLSLRKSLIA